jgi:hypothetical protein
MQAVCGSVVRKNAGSITNESSLSRFGQTSFLILQNIKRPSLPSQWKPTTSTVILLRLDSLKPVRLRYGKYWPFAAGSPLISNKQAYLPPNKLAIVPSITANPTPIVLV